MSSPMFTPTSDNGVSSYSNNHNGLINNVNNNDHSIVHNNGHSIAHNNSITDNNGFGLTGS